TVSNITVEGNYFSSVFEDNIVIEPDTDYEQTVTFAPEEGGDFEGVLTITSDDPDNEQVEVTLTGNAADAEAIIAVFPDTLNFDVVTIDESADLSIWIRNDGNIELNVSDITFEGNWFTSDFENELIVQIGDSVDVTVTFAPEELGDHEATLTVTSNDPNNGEVDVNLTGTCIRAGGIVINVPDDFNTIQEAIDASMDADTILVQPEVYVEIINFNGKNIVVGSLFITTGDEDYIESTIIDGDANGRSVIVIRNGETEEAVLSGFTIRNADTDYGGGCYIRSSSPTLDHLLITGNHVSDRGAGIYCTADATPTISYVTVVGNTADSDQGGLGVGGNAVATVVNSIFWGNDPTAISGGQTFTFSCIEGSYAGNGNIEDDPQFVDSDNGDYHITEDSPCIDTGDPNSPEDSDATRADMGAFHFNQWQGPRIILDPIVIGFGEVIVDQSSDLTLTISNTGNEDLIISDVSIEGAYFSSDFENEINIEPNNSHELTVTFAPGELGDLAGNMTIFSNDPVNDEISLELSGIGVAEEPEIVVEPDTLAFGFVVVDQTDEMTVTISNDGHADLTVSNAVVEGDNFAVVFEDNIVIGINESAELTVSFTPNAEGDFGGTLTITSDDPNRETVDVALTGSGANPDIELNPESLAFGAVVVNQSEQLTLTISNVGQANLTIDEIGVAGAYFAVDFEQAIVIEPNNSYEFNVIFTPEDGGDFQGTLSISSDDPDESLVEVGLSGTGVMPVIIVDSQELNFGEVAIDNAREMILNIGNDGNGDLTISEIVLAGDQVFSIEFDGEVVIEPEGNYEQAVTFAPVQGLDYEGTLTIQSDDPQNGEVVVDLVGVGRGPRLWDVGAFNTPGSAEGVFVRGDYAYVADYWEGLQIYNVSDPENPEAVGSFDTPGTAYGVYVEGDYAYVADFSSGLRIIDISNPAEPDEVGAYDTDGRSYAVQVIGDYAYVADEASGICIVDVSDPTDPTVVGTYDTPGQSLDLYVIDGYAYVADHSQGLRVIDVSDPENPDEIAYYETDRNAYGVHVAGGYAYVTNVADGLLVIDVSSPENPHLAGVADTPGDAYGVDIFGDYAYVADGDEGLGIVNITDAENPEVVDGIDTPEFAINVFVSGDYAYVADEGEGVRIIDITYYLPPAPEIAVSPDPLDFGSVIIDQPLESTLTISNEGNADLIVDNISSDVDLFSLDFEGETVIEPDNFYELTVTFIPVEVGEFTASITITSNDDENPELTVDLIGSGRATLMHIPDDFETIQAGINAAFDGDTLLVDAGTYTENINFNGKDIIVGSLMLTTGDQDYIASTIIDGDANGSSVVVFRNGETEDARLTGFTIRNGDTDFGGGVYVNAASPSLDHLLITANTASRRGGGVYATSNANVNMTNVTISGNSAEESGGAMNVFAGAGAVVTSSILWSNDPPALPADLTVTYTDVESGYNGEGNIDEDPLFAFDFNGSYYIIRNSPCIDTGDPDAEQDPDETRADMGAFFFNQPMEPDIAFDPESLDFGEVLLGETEELMLTVLNEGRTNLRFSSNIAVEGQYFGYGGEDPEFIEVQPNDRYEIPVGFWPEEIGDFEGSLTFTSNDPDEGESVVLLYGSGVGPVIAVSPEAIDFGEVVIDQTVRQMLTITNEGNRDLTINGVEIGGEPIFLCDFEGEVVIQPNESYDLAVTFTPDGEADFEDMLVIHSNDLLNEAVEVQLNGVGREPDIPLVGRYNTDGSATSSFVRDNIVFVADDNNGLVILDVSDFDNIEEINQYDTPGSMVYLEVIDNIAYLANQASGLRIIDVSNLENLDEIGYYDSGGSTSSLQIVGNIAYLCDGSHGFLSIDISDFENPDILDRYDSRGSVMDVSIYNQFAFLADWDDGVKVVNISDPEDLREVANLETENQTRSIDIVGDFAYVTTWEADVIKIDISDPANPEIVGSYETPGNPTEVKVIGNIAFVADMESGFRIIDISDSDNMIEVGYYDTQGRANAVTIYGDYAYVGDMEAGLVILDVSDFVQYPDIAVGTDSLDFGVVLIGTEEELTLNISNEGNWDLTIEDITLEQDGFSTDFEGEVVLEPLADAYQLTVTFAPDATGDFEGTLTIHSDDPDQGEIEIVLSGIGVAPDIAVDPETLDFGEVSLVGDGADMTISISNAGDYPLTVSNVTIEGDYYSSGFGGEFSLDPEDAYELTVHFAPEDVGQLDAMLIILSDDPDSGELEVPLTGIGVAEDFKLYVPDDYETIQAAIDAAEDGDSILVHPGTYTENIHYSDKNIVIGSLWMMTGDDAYVDSTIIDGDDGGITVNMRENLTSEAVLSGFTITGGSASYGGGIYINASSPVLDHLLITANHASRWGAGIYCTHAAQPTLINVTAAGNTADIGNAGIHTYDNSDAIVVSSVFWDNVPSNVSAGMTVSYSCFEGGYAGNENIDADPLFIDSDNGNYHLIQDSPCIDTGDPDAPADPDESRVDMGTFRYIPTPSIAVSPDTLDFDEVAMGQRGVMSLTITNEGSANLTVSDVTVRGEPTFLSAFEDELVIEPNDSYNLTVTFAPDETGDLAGTLTITSDDPQNEEVTVELNGVGREPDIPEVGHLDTDGDAIDVVVVGNYAYVADGWEGLRIIDVSDPENPDEVGFYDTENRAVSVSLAGNYAYLVGNGVFSVFDVSDPENPDEISSLDVGGSGVAVSGSYVYLAGAGMRIVDVSDPENPEEVALHEIPGEARGITVEGNYAYLGNWENGLRIYDITDPENVEELGDYDTPGRSRGIAISGNYAYVADSEGGLRVINISDKENPDETGDIETPGVAEFVSVVGNFAFVAAHTSGLRIIDITDPENPADAGNHDTQGLAYGIDVVGDYAYIADHENGLVILDVSDFVQHPAIAVSTNELDFGDISINFEEELTLTIQNAGDGQLAVSDIVLDGDNFSIDFEDAISLAEEENYELTVTFAPDDESEFVGTLTIASNDAENPEVVIDLHGFGVNDAPRVVNPIDDFEIDEDSGFHEIVDLDDVFEDPNGDEMSFRVSAPLSLNPIITDENVLTIEPDENYYGEDIEVTVTADDERGGRLMVRIDLSGLGTSPTTNSLNERVGADLSSPVEIGLSELAPTRSKLAPTRMLRSTNSPPYSPEDRTPRRDATENLTFAVIINGLNDDPVWEQYPENNRYEVSEGNVAEFDLVAQDTLDNNDQLSIEISDLGGLPNEDVLTDNGNGNASFSWETSIDDEGEYHPVFTVSDGEAVVDLAITIAVTHANQPPEVTNPIDDIEIDEDSEMIEIADLDTVFTDPDDDELSFSYEAVDELNLNIDVDNILTLEPEENYFGELNVVIEADDGVERARMVLSVQGLLSEDNHARVGADLSSPVEIGLSKLAPTRSLRSIGIDQSDHPRRDATVNDEFTVTVNPVNDAPVIVDGEGNPLPPELDIDLPENEEFRLTLGAIDVDEEQGLNWEFDANDLPDNWEFNDIGNGYFEFIWTSGFDDEGQYSALFTVTDSEEATDELTVNINVIHVNRPPWFPQIEDVEFEEDSGPFVVADLDTVFYDPDEDELAYMIETDNESLIGEIDNDNVLTLVADENFNGEGIEVTVTADDGMERAVMVIQIGVSNNIANLQNSSNRQIRSTSGIKAQNPRRDDVVEEIFLATITPVNDTPFWVDPPEEVEAREGEQVEFTLTADDVDLDIEGDELTLELIADDGTIDRGAEFTENDDNTCRFSWQTDEDDEGEYNLVFEVRDLARELERVGVTITVSNSNRPPVVVNPIPDQNHDEDCGRVEIADLDTVFSDPDDDQLFFDIINAPRELNMEVNPDDNVLFFEPDTNFHIAEGVEITIHARDPEDASADDPFILTLNPVNDAPVIDREIDDVVIDEDADPRRVDIADLDDIFSDPDGDDMIFSFSVSEEIPDSLLNMVINDWNILYFRPDDNLTIADGVVVTITATDENDAPTNLEFSITINPVNDLPSAFDLLTPGDNNFVLGGESLEFTWQESEDIEDSTVTYDLVLNYDGEDHWRMGLEVASISINREELGIEYGDTTEIEWSVWAYDGIDSLQSESVFSLSLVYLSVGDDNNPLIPTELTLESIYPNPFNARATIHFGLPAPSKVRLSVYDLSGRNIQMLVDEYLSAGYHTAVFNADNLTAGVYFVRIATSDEVRVQKVMLIR
ncbi:MAG: choice-of-anchor D domain-containing protein, partial [Calditrichaeota bacterium]|nr:choice-of-anchor D domain-containing protein [Calditrichota bacterium]